VKFEDYAREASKALSSSGRSVEVPALSEMWARRRRAGVILGSATIALVVAGTIGVIARMGGIGTDDDVANGSEVVVPAATVPVDEGGILFGPPRIEKADTVEFPITLLDGTRLTLTLPRSLADDVDGLVPGGAASWELDPCCARTLEVIYGSIDELYGDRQPDIEYEDADGNPVGFYTEVESLDYLVFQYGSWIVRAWDDDAEGQRLTEENRERFASLMSGHETPEGFLVLEPIPPMTIGPGDGPDATLTTGNPEEGLVGVFEGRDCASEGPSANPDLVTSTGNLVSLAEESGMTSICWPDASFFVWVARLDLTDAELEAVELKFATGTPIEEVSTTTTSTTLLTSTTIKTSGEPSVTPIALDQSIPLRVLAVRPNNPSLAVIDLSERTTTVYGPGVHALPLDATDGAVATPSRDWIIWTNGVARLFSDGLDHVDQILGPSPPREISGFAPAIRVVPTPDSRRAWLVQPGITYGDNDHATIVDLVDIEDGSVLLRSETDGSAFPVAATDDGLVLNSHNWLDTGDGFTEEPGSEVTILLNADGSTNQIGAGRALAASANRVVRVTSNQLLISDPDGSNEVEVLQPFDGAWVDIGGPGIPSDAMPFQTVSPDGSEVLISLGREFDVNGSPGYSELIAVDISDGSTRSLAEFDGTTPNATWSSDGEWIALFWQDDITLIDAFDSTVVIPLEDVVPAGHFPLAAG